jgi:hypothetical protein
MKNQEVTPLDGGTCGTSFKQEVIAKNTHLSLEFQTPTQISSISVKNQQPSLLTNSLQGPVTHYIKDHCQCQHHVPNLPTQKYTVLPMPCDATLLARALA